MRRLVGPVLVCGAVFSVALAIVCFLWADRSTAIGVLAGLAGIVVTLQVQTLLVQQRRQERLTRQTRLVAAIEGVDWLPERVERITASVAKIEREYGATPAAVACRHALTDCHGRLTELERGHLTVSSNAHSLATDLTDGATTTMYATGLPDLEFWQSPDGQRYWERHERAIARGVEIHRVFVYEDWSAELDKTARRQASAGVKVLRIRADQLPAALRSGVTLWDGSCVYEQGKGLFTVARADVALAADRYQVVESEAEALPPKGK